MRRVDPEGVCPQRRFGAASYDPYGQPVTAGPFATVTGTANYGWLGQHQRLTEESTGHIWMGERLYNPSRVRFLQVDPVENGTPNDYVYPADPINQNDLTGRRLDYDGSPSFSLFQYGDVPLFEAVALLPSGAMSCVFYALGGGSRSGIGFEAHISCGGFAPPLSVFQGSGSVAIDVVQTTAVGSTTYSYEGSTGAGNTPYRGECFFSCAGEFQTTVTWSYTQPGAKWGVFGGFPCSASGSTVTCTSVSGAVSGRRRR